MLLPRKPLSKHAPRQTTPDSLERLGSRNLSYKSKWHTLIFFNVISMIFVILSSKRQIKNILWTNTTQVSLFFLSFTGNQAGFSDPQRSTCFELSAVCINTAWIPNLPKVGSVGSEQFGGDFSKQNIKYQNFFCFISLQQYRQLPAPNASASYFCSSVYWDMEIILQGFGVWCMWLSHLAGLLLGLSRFILGGTIAKKVSSRIKCHQTTQTTDFYVFEEWSPRW